MIAMGLLATSLALADGAPTEETIATETVKSQHGYVSMGAGPLPFPIPLFGIGGRFQHGHHGADLSIQGVTFGSGFSILKENVDYLYYFKPKLASQFYMGAGVSATEFFSHGKVSTTLSPQFLFGKQYTNENQDVRFFQAQIEPVFFSLKGHHRMTTFPSVILSYGICF